MGGSLDTSATRDRKSATNPAVDGLPGNGPIPCGTQDSGERTLPANSKKRALKRGSIGNHADIVATMSAECTQEDARLVIKLGMDVWKHIEEELHRRRLKAAWLGKKLVASRQVVSGWKTRGVPSSRYEQIAALFGWSIDRLVTGVDDAPTIAAITVSASPADAIYSPMALDVARMIDAIPDEQQKRRAYALILQLLAMDAAPSPTVPAPAPSVPAASPTPEPSRGR